MQYTDYLPFLRQRLSEKRFCHSVCTCNEAIRLAKKYGADEQKAGLAGILHDCMKEEPAEKQLKFLNENGIILTDAEMQSPAIWHGYAGAVYIREKLGLKDEEIYNAVFFHSTGRANMTLLEKILFLADFTGEDRKFFLAQSLRETEREQGLNAAVFAELRYTVQKLKERGAVPAGQTLSAYLYYQQVQTEV